MSTVAVFLKSDAKQNISTNVKCMSKTVMPVIVRFRFKSGIIKANVLNDSFNFTHSV